MISRARANLDVSARALRSGFLGKLPAHGDFVSRGLKARSTQKLDQWLVALVEHWQEVSGARFANAYLTAGPVRLALVEPLALAAAIVPSIDRVGRRFPLLAVHMGSSDPSKTAASLELAIASAVSYGWTADQLQAAIMAIEDRQIAETLPAETYPSWHQPDPTAAPMLCDLLCGIPAAILSLREALT